MSGGISPINDFQFRKNKNGRKFDFGMVSDQRTRDNQVNFDSDNNIISKKIRVVSKLCEENSDCNLPMYDNDISPILGQSDNKQFFNEPPVDLDYNNNADEVVKNMKAKKSKFNFKQAGMPLDNLNSSNRTSIKTVTNPICVMVAPQRNSLRCISYNSYSGKPVTKINDLSVNNDDKFSSKNSKFTESHEKVDSMDYRFTEEKVDFEAEKQKFYKNFDLDESHKNQSSYDLSKSRKSGKSTNDDIVPFKK